MRLRHAILGLSIAGPSLAGAQSDTRPTVAVTDFKGGSLARPADYAALGRGITELLTTSLAGNPAVRVAERQQLDQILAEQHLVEGGQIDPATAVRLGKILGVRHFVTGGFLIDGRNHMRFDVVSVNVETSELEYRETVEGSVDNLFEVIGRMDKKLAAAIGVTLTPQQAGGARPNGKGDEREAILQLGKATRALASRDTTAGITAARASLKAFPGFPRAQALLDSLTAKKP